MLESYLKNRLKEKEILLMTHIVLGYPTFEDSFEIIESMVNTGVDLMELQIPFSEPIADGPVILNANQKSLSRKTTVKKCMDFAHKVTRAFDVPFLFMSYYNILFKFGVERFTEAMAQNAIKGAIVPDLPPEEGSDYLGAMEKHNLVPIFIFSPTTPDERMKYLASFGKGFIYCVARKGVTGVDTDFSDQLKKYLARCRKATDLPLALGFGVKEKEDVDFLKGKADIAVVGSQTIRLVDQKGVGAVGQFIKSLR
ncbi:MAG: tryptophan synthase subunit alpha [Deltaproteobacteria bacterium]|nr:tryptophan synthase subunit alpha [Deltaproteobacteria bacterium]MBW1958055.1 tryptophan synthase subunit alpha [Deltaproteobacteria bacterium]MBW2089169.1 tryptophan synthase subunit alpha [Deltaproteobacteria bacterium]MBW2320946.1 tryptophan synthase subunit alpha [Deltaproteobacteria bacterium]